MLHSTFLSICIRVASRCRSLLDRHRLIYTPHPAYLVTRKMWVNGSHNSSRTDHETRQNITPQTICIINWICSTSRCYLRRTGAWVFASYFAGDPDYGVILGPFMCLAGEIEAIACRSLHRLRLLQTNSSSYISVAGFIAIGYFTVHCGISVDATRLAWQ